MRKIVLAASVALAAITVSACGGKSPTTQPTEKPEAVALTEAEKASVNEAKPADLVGFVRNSSGAKFDYADERLSGILKTTTDVALVTAVTEYQLPMGSSSRREAFMAKLRLKI